MQDFASKDANVKLVLLSDKKKEIADDFDEVELPEDYSDEWKKNWSLTSTVSLYAV
jgi:hypothetical protein